MKLAGIICWAKGHQRGVQVGAIGLTSQGTRERIFECPRCGRKTRYKVKPKPEQSSGAPTDGSARYTVEEAI